MQESPGEMKQRLVEELRTYLGEMLDDEVGSSKWDEPDKPEGVVLEVGDGTCPDCGGKHAPDEPHHGKNGGADNLASILGAMR